MTALARRKRRRPNVRRAVILFPSGLTLGNLFFGVFAIIAASRLEFVAAGVYVLLGGICDALDGRVARATNAGTEFGEELDSLVDAITFGLAPGMIMYFAVLNRTGWDWVWVFVFSACAVLRLARFNIEQAGTAKTYFQGLPSPAAGITLASYYWFSQSSLYTYGAIADLKWHVLLRYLMAMLSFLMISNVPYPVFPRTGFRSLRAAAATVLLIGSVVLLATRRLEFFFPCALIYVAWGLLRWVLSGLFERRQPTIPYDLSEGEDDEEEDEEDDDDEFGLDSEVHATRWSHRGDRGARAERTSRAERQLRDEARDEARPRGERGAGPAAVTERAAERAGPTRDSDRAKESERPRRDGKQKERPRRPDRPPREPRAAAPSTAVPPELVTGVDAITLGEPATSETAAMGGRADALPLASETAEAALPARKRKRRRRRGERKDRSGGDSASTSSDAGEGDGDDSEDAATEPGAQSPASSARVAPIPPATTPTADAPAPTTAPEPRSTIEPAE